MSGHTPATRFDDAPDVEMRFPPLSRTVAVVAHLISQNAEVPDTPQLLAAVNADPVIAASVLRRINSAYYGMPRQIGDIERAVFLLGFVEVCNLVVSAGMMKLRDVLRSDEQERIFDEISRTSLITAAYTQALVHALEIPGASIAFTAGLLHPVGRLVLLYNRPDDYEALWCTTSGGHPSADAERIIFGTDHCELSGMAIRAWNLPDDLMEVVGSYSAPDAVRDRRLREIAQVLHVAVLAAHQYDEQSSSQRAFNPPAVLDDLAVSRGKSVPALADVLRNTRPMTLE